MNTSQLNGPRRQAKALRTAALLCGAAACLMSSSPAHANLEECGGVFIFAEAQCEFQPTEECMTDCMAVAVETSCAAQIYVDCEGGCTASATTDCETSCSDVCTTDCVQQEAATEEPPNCMGLCMSDCQQTCTDTCADAEKKGPCRSCCAHTCGDKCEALCKEEPDAAVAECTPTCTNVCTGSCTAQANVQCQIDCQTKVYAQCETETVERCETQCKTTGGAIFCDGQFLNATDINACAEELASSVDIHVDIEVAVEAKVDVSSGKDNDTLDDVSTKVDKACSVARVGSSDSGRGSLVLFGLFALGAAWRRRTRRVLR